jgi:hypothetical protein
MVMVIVREREHALSWGMPRAQVDGFLPKFGKPESLQGPSRYPRFTWNFDGTRVSFLDIYRCPRGPSPI